MLCSILRPKQLCWAKIHHGFAMERQPIEVKLNIFLLLMVCSIWAQSAPDKSDIVSSNLEFRLIAGKDKCGDGCIVIIQTLINRGKQPIAIQPSEIGRVTSLSLATKRTQSNEVPAGQAMMSVGDHWPDAPSEIQCVTLHPGKTFRTQIHLAIPSIFPKGSFLYLQQDYTQFQTQRCGEAELFTGRIKSNRLRILNK